MTIPEYDECDCGTRGPHAVCRKPDELTMLAAKLPGYTVIQKCLWVGNERVEIDHIDNDLDKPLNYIKAFKQMASRLNIK